MSTERFSAWYFTQPELVQLLGLYGPPLLVSIVIGLALGGRLRLMLLAWKFDPALAASLDSLRSESEEDADSAWTHNARDSVDDLVQRRRRGLP